MKISLDNLNKVMDRCTKKEIDFIIYVGQFQDIYGVVKGVNYKDVIDGIGIAKSTFYKLLYSLEEKEIIEINYINEYAYWEITFIDNVFACDDDYTKGYLKLNYEILHSEYFRDMTKSEKVIVLNLIKINDYRDNKIRITLKRLKMWTGKSRRSVLSFVDTLSKCFHIIRQGNTLIIDCMGFQLRAVSEADIRNIHLINYRLSKAKIDADRKDIKDTNTVFKQYKINVAKTITKVIDTVINSVGMLIPSVVNKVAKQLI